MRKFPERKSEAREMKTLTFQNERDLLRMCFVRFARDARRKDYKEITTPTLEFHR